MCINTSVARSPLLPRSVTWSPCTPPVSNYNKNLTKLSTTINATLIPPKSWAWWPIARSCSRIRSSTFGLLKISARTVRLSIRRRRKWRRTIVPSWMNTSSAVTTSNSKKYSHKFRISQKHLSKRSRKKRKGSRRLFKIKLRANLRAQRVKPSHRRFAASSQSSKTAVTTSCVIPKMASPRRSAARSSLTISRTSIRNIPSVRAVTNVRLRCLSLCRIPLLTSKSSSVSSPKKPIRVKQLKCQRNKQLSKRKPNHNRAQKC